MAVHPNLIKTIYLYVFSGVGLALILFGSYSAIRYFVNVTQFEQYPLAQWEETQCAYPAIGYSVAKPVMEDRTNLASPSAEEIEKQEKLCKENTEKQRKRKQTDDLTHTLATLLIGILVFIPHWKLARKSS